MSNLSTMHDLVRVVETLRAPGGCPWDREQTWQSLMPYILEEAYELKEAMQLENADMLREELGDVLLHVVMLSAMAAECQWFTLSDVAAGVTEKMIRRHPHVFGEASAKNADEVVHHWDRIKGMEKPQNNSFGADISHGLPALIRAQKLQRRAAKLGFDFPTTAGAIDKIKEELSECEHAFTIQNSAAISEELGDLLFSVVNVCRKAGMDAEVLLDTANHKFAKRMTHMGASDVLPLDEWDKRWEKVKALQ